MSNSAIKKLIGGCVAGLIVLIGLFSTFTTVNTGTTGVKVWLGEVQNETLDEGFHLKVPLLCSVVEMSNKVQKIDVEADATSKDLQSIISTLSINYHLAPESSASMYQRVGQNYEDTLLQPAIQEATKNVMAQYRAEQLITERSNVGAQVLEAIAAKVKEYGILIDKFNITNFSFSKAFDEAIEQKLVAEQNKIKAQTENEQRVAAAEADAAEQKAKAEGEAEAIKAKANAEAEAIKAKADAEAEANKKINESLSKDLIDYKQIEQWDGKVPVISGSGSNLLLDAGDIIK